MFEALLDSAAAEGYTSSQSGETTRSSKSKSWLGALADPNPSPSPNPTPSPSPSPNPNPSPSPNPDPDPYQVARPRALRPPRARRTARSRSWREPPYCPLEPLRATLLRRRGP